MAITLLPKQQDAINGMLKKNVGILCMPTACGKTVVIYGHAKNYFNTAVKHNFIISGPIMDLNKQTAGFVITNLYNDGLITPENCDIVVANCSNRKVNTFFTVFKNGNIILAKNTDGNTPANIIVNTIDVKQEKQYRITVVCNPTLQADEKFLDKLNDNTVIKHFYFDETHTLKKEPKSIDIELVETKKSGEAKKNWVNYKKIFNMISQNNGSCHFVSATPTKDNFDTILENNFGLNYDDCFAYRITPLEAINAHMIVPPEFKINKCDKLTTVSILQMIEIVVNDINKIKEEKPEYKARILITVNSVDELVYAERQLNAKYGDEYDVYSTCCAEKKKKNLSKISDDIIAFKDCIENNERSCFVVHIRQIIAGIDIPSFTHAVFNMESTTNFIAPIQITGRVLRPGHRFADGSADLTVKNVGYVYVNIEANCDIAVKAARTLVDYYGAIFKFLKPEFFEGYSNGSNNRHKRMSQFEDEVAMAAFEDYIKKFLKKTAREIYLAEKVGGLKKPIRQTIEENIIGYGYVENLPIFYVPELKKYIDQVKDYIDLLKE